MSSLDISRPLPQHVAEPIAAITINLPVVEIIAMLESAIERKPTWLASIRPAWQTDETWYTDRELLLNPRFHVFVNKADGQRSVLQWSDIVTRTGYFANDFPETFAEILEGSWCEYTADVWFEYICFPTF